MTWVQHKLVIILSTVTSSLLYTKLEVWEAPYALPNFCLDPHIYQHYSIFIKFEHKIAVDEGFMHTDFGATTVFEAQNWQKVTNCTHV